MKTSCCSRKAAGYRRRLRTRIADFEPRTRYKQYIIRRSPQLPPPLRPVEPTPILTTPHRGKNSVDPPPGHTPPSSPPPSSSSVRIVVRVPQQVTLHERRRRRYSSRTLRRRVNINYCLPETFYIYIPAWPTLVGAATTAAVS